jgi:hypothetical protein
VPRGLINRGMLPKCELTRPAGWPNTIYLFASPFHSGLDLPHIHHNDAEHYIERTLRGECAPLILNIRKANQ